MKMKKASHRQKLKTSSVVNNSPLSWEREGHANLFVLRERVFAFLYCFSCLTPEDCFIIHLQYRSHLSDRDFVDSLQDS